MKYLYLLFSVICATLISFKFSTAPWIGISLCWFIVFLFATKWTNSSVLKAVWFNFSIVILLFVILESYLWIKKPVEAYTEYDHPEYLFTDNDILGTVPLKNGITNAQEFYKDEKVFDVNYTIDSQGLRLSDNTEDGDNTKSILFFGDSFMFGWGVKDTETIPYQVGLKTNNYTVYNFGFIAYGPNHMLASIENGIVETVVKKRPVFAFYEAIFDSVNRSAGLSLANRNPKYILDKNKQIVYKGRFDQYYIIPPYLKDVLLKSMIFNSILNRHRDINSNDIDLFIGIVAKSKELLNRLYPDIRFYVLIYDNGNASGIEEMISKLNKNKIDVIRTSKILLTDKTKTRKDYEIINTDTHPNARADQLVADYLVKEIIGS